MKVSCVLRATDIAAPAGIVLFPEGVELGEMRAASDAHPRSWVVGAVADQGMCRGLLLRGKSVLVDYLKVESDGRTKGSENPEQNSVFEDQSCCIGVIICKDIDNLPFSERVLERLKASKASYKILCIPADMGSEWFNGPELFPQARYSGINVALCNHTRTHEARCKSFVTDVQGRKVNIQRGTEPLNVMLP